MRQALEYMRYASCTQANIEYLQTRIANNKLGQPKLSDKNLRNVSIITGRNARRDGFNNLDINRFAKDTNQSLIHFYSTWV